MPIRSERQIIGVMFLSTQLPRQITQEEVRLVQAMAEIAGTTIDRLGLLEGARRDAQQLEIINRVGRALSESLEQDEIYDRLQAALYGLIPNVSTVIFTRFDSERELITPVYVNHLGEVQDASVLQPIPLEPPGHGLQSEAIRTRKPVISNRLREDIKERVQSITDVKAPGPKTQSALVVPMLAKERVIGTIYLQSFEPDYFTQAHADMLGVIGNTAAVAIENARLFEQTQRSISRLNSLRAIDMAITGEPDLDATLEVLLNQAMGQLHIDAACVLVRNRATGNFEYADGQGFKTQALSNTELPYGEGYAGRAAAERRIIEVRELDRRKTDFLRSPDFAMEGFKVYYGAPLIAKGQVVGVLELFFRTPFEADSDWLAFLEAIAGQAAIAIDSVHLFEDLERTNIKLLQAYDATIEGWSRALDYRDKETEDHTRRVTEMTLRLARSMGNTNQDEMVYIRWGALLHDIGKIGIPDAILHKPGPLDDEEWQIVRRHPILAYEMLEPIEFLHPALDIPYCHHEKWDGSGYPRGLKGEAIPLAARIFAIVDVWDALTNERPYRAAWTQEKALAHLRAQSGSHFDPRVVRAFEGLLLESGKPAEQIGHAPPTLLIVDDEENILRSLARSLRDKFTVRTARSGSEALKVLASEKVALILTDQRMPGMTGLQLLERLQTEYPAVPAVLLSGYSDSASLAATLNLENVRGYIAKPWDIDQLLRQLRTAANGTAALEEHTEEGTEAS